VVLKENRLDAHVRISVMVSTVYLSLAFIALSPLGVESRFESPLNTDGYPSCAVGFHQQFIEWKYNEKEYKFICLFQVEISKSDLNRPADLWQDVETR